MKACPHPPVSNSTQPLVQKLLLSLLTSAFLAFQLHAAQEASPEKTGLAVGRKAPAFTLKDQTGKEVSLESLLKTGPVALVFHRSADW